jgi:hypothetical protein
LIYKRISIGKKAARLLAIAQALLTETKRGPAKMLAI